VGPDHHPGRGKPDGAGNKDDAVTWKEEYQRREKAPTVVAWPEGKLWNAAWLEKGEKPNGPQSSK